MPTVRQKNGAARKLANFFARARKIHSKHEYRQVKGAPLRIDALVRTFGTYERMVNYVIERHPYLDGMQEADALEAPKKVVKETKPAGLEALKKASTKKVESTDE